MIDDKKLAFAYIARMRRDLRLVARRRGALLDDHRSLRRKVRLLKDRGNPFAASRIRTMEATMRDIDDAARVGSGHIRELGKLLAGASHLIDAATTLSERCDILNVNIADRGNLTEDDGFVKIVFAHGLEDSAASRHAQWKDGLFFNALQLMFLDFLMHTREGRKVGDSLFAPGGLFEGVPSYTMNANGTMTRNPPRLSVVAAAEAHDDDCLSEGA